MKKMTEDNCRIGGPKVMTNTKGAPYIIIVVIIFSMKEMIQKLWGNFRKSSYTQKKMPLMPWVAIAK